MKKLYRSRGTVHPSPGPTISDHLSFLPAYLLTLTASLSPPDLEVLAYLISTNNTNTNTNTTTTPLLKRGPQQKNPSFPPNSKSCSVPGGGGGDGDHAPNFCCDCFGCYMSYWVRWDTSPNRQLIDEIIDAYEDGLVRNNGGNNGRGGRGRKERRKARGSEASSSGSVATASAGGGLEGGKGLSESEIGEPDQPGESGEVGCGGGEEPDKGSMRKLVSFIGERIWGAWN